MAMMMAGRVLLVCALCVLWCGAGGVYARDALNNAQGGCMVSGVLGAKTSYLVRGCNKTVLTRSLRSAFFINAIQAEAKDVKDISEEGDNLKLGSIPQPPAPPPAPETPPPPDASDSDVIGRSELGAESQTGGGGGGSGGISNGGEDTTLKVPVPDDKSSSPIPNAGDGLRNTGDSSVTQKNNPSGTDEPSKKPLNVPALPTVQTPEALDPDQNENTPNTQGEISVEARGKGESGGDAGESDVNSKGSSSVSTAKSNPTGKTTPSVPSTGETPTITATPKDSENPTGKNDNTAASGTETDTEATKKSSKDDAAEQHSQERDKADLVKSANTGHPAYTAASSISTYGNGDAQGKANENGDDPERHDSKRTHDALEADNTNVAPTASEAAPEAVNSTEKHDTVPTGDSDGSTAVSHTTSPLLLLLLVAFAAAAAVVAA
ncbi:mucin-associated surface protein [Trypanosoma cruzi cruzi]|uniref:Mucin-associated surface protein (MASP) n=1 Tax=Trypanosoma cruzi TaxID=5693 RepID=A0A2V2VR06_TRYCR|nr:mucin-associated surface protein [Trypanosoma cruzi cruzi]PWU98730.1 Mucin-associated surface protein (MASP) [Trypanosoma cruzi]